MKYSISVLLLSWFVISAGFANSLRDAEVAIRAKKYEVAIQLLESSQRDRGVEQDYVLFLIARAKMLSEDFSGAKIAAESLLKDFSQSKWADKSYFLIAETYHQQNLHEQAVMLYRERAMKVFAIERKQEIAGELMSYAQKLVEDNGELRAEVFTPDYSSAYQLYKEVLDIECGSQLHEQARLKMIYLQQQLAKHDLVERECLAYLAAYDERWRGKVGSLERIMAQQNTGFVHQGSQVAQVRYWFSEALHRQNKRALATVYLNELIKEVKDKNIAASDGLLADSEWLRLHTLRSPGGSVAKLDYWLSEAKQFLKSYPTHVHAEKTAFLIPSIAFSQGELDDAELSYERYIKDAFGSKVVQSPLTQETEDEKAFTKREKEAAGRREMALYKLGEIYLQKHEFERARKVWSDCLVDYPNGVKWPDIQKQLSGLEYEGLLHKLSLLNTEEGYETSITSATEMIDDFVEKYPLHAKLIDLLYQRGKIPYSFAERELGESNQEKANRLYQLAIEQWQPLMKRYPDTQQSKESIELSGLVYIEQLDDLEKGIEFLQKAKTQTSVATLAALENESLTVSSPQRFSLQENPYVELDTRNVKKVKVKLYWMDVESYFLKAADLSDAVNLDLDLVEPDKVWDYEVKDYRRLRDVTSKLEIPYSEGEPGVCVVKVESEKFESSTLVQRGNLDVVIRSSARDLVAFVKNAVTNKPERGAHVMIASDKKVILRGRTDENGVFHTALALPEGHHDYRVLVSSKNGQATTFSRVILADDYVDKSLLKAWFHVDRDDIRIGDQVLLSAVVRQAQGGKFIYPKDLDYKLSVGIGSVSLVEKQVTLTKEGYLSEKIRIPRSSKGEELYFQLMQVDDPSIRLDGSERIMQDAEFKGSVTINFDKTYVKEGDILNGKVVANYTHGGPIADTKFKLGLPRGLSIPLVTNANGEAEFTYDTLADLAGSYLEFSAHFDSIHVYSEATSVTLDPVDLEISVSTNKNKVLEGEVFTLDLVTKSFTADPVAAKLNVEILQKDSYELLDLVGAQSKLVTKLEKVDSFELATSGEEGYATHDLKLEKSGRYYVKVVGQDRFGVEVTQSLTVDVLGEGTKEKLSVFRDEVELYDDMAVNLRFFSKLSKPTPVLMSIETDLSIQRQVVTLEQGENTLSLPLDSRHSPGFTCTLMAIDDRELYTASLDIKVKTKLNIETSYAGIDEYGKATAGEKITAKVKVTNSSGEAVPAILIGTLNPWYKSELDSEGDVLTWFDVDYEAGRFQAHTSCAFVFQGKQKQLLVFSDENEQTIPSSASAMLSVSNADRIRKYLYKGEGYYNLGHYDKAAQEFGKVLRIDKYNQVARSWQSRILGAQSAYYRSEYGQSSSMLISKVFSSVGTEEILVPEGVNNNVDAFGDVDDGGSFGILPHRTRRGKFSIKGSSLDPFADSSELIEQKQSHYSPASQLPVWSSPLVILSEEQELKVPLPKQAGSWKLEFHAFGKESRKALAQELVVTKSDYTFSVNAPSVMYEGDRWTPVITLFRVDAEEEEILNIDIKVAVGDEVKEITQEVIFVKGYLTAEVNLESVSGVQGAGIEISISESSKGLKHHTHVDVQAWGPVVQDHLSKKVSAGQAEWLKLSLPESASADLMTVSITPGFNAYLVDLALSDPVVFDYCFDPFVDYHPSGRLLAITAVLDYLKDKNSGEGKAIDSLKEQGRWSYDELVASMDEKGYWTTQEGTKYASDWTTAFSYIALQRWRKLGLADEAVISKSEAWLQARYGQIELNDLETRSLFQMVLAYGGKASFSECNRLFRNSKNLTSAAKLFLSQSYLLQSRKGVAQDLMGALMAEPVDSWSAHYPVAQRKAFLFGWALVVNSQLDEKPQRFRELKELVLKDALGSSRNYLIRGSVISGLAALEALSEEKAGTGAQGKGEVYLGDKKILSFDLSDEKPTLQAVVEQGLVENTELKVTFSGQSSVFVSASLVGSKPTYTTHKPSEETRNPSGIYDRWYLHSGLSYVGKPLQARGASLVKSVQQGDEVVVQVRCVNADEASGQSLIAETIPKGFGYVKGSFEGRHNGVEYIGGKLLVRFNSRFSSRYYRYKIVAVQPGEWRHEPTVFIPLSNVEKPLYGPVGKLTVLPKGEKSTDPYVYNAAELQELAKLHFEDIQYREAEAYIQKLLAIKNDEPSATVAAMQLWIEVAKDSPDPQVVVDAFETLDALSPDFSIPFATVKKVAYAYTELQEYERAYYVYAALVEGSFAQDSYVAFALEQQNRLLDAIDVMSTLWQKYPVTGGVGTSRFSYGQNLFAQASEVKKLKNREGLTDPLTSDGVYQESVDLLQGFLTLYPEHPSSDEAAYTIANGLFSLKKYSELVDQASTAVLGYPQSDLLNSFRYMTALGAFWQRKYEDAIAAAQVVANGTSEDKDLAGFITAQIYHAQGNVKQAQKWYEKVKESFPDASTSLAYFEQKKLSLEEVNLFDSTENVSLEIKHRNIGKAVFTIYEVDLMQLYLKHRNLSGITSINLAGIEPDFSIEKELVQKVETNDSVTRVSLPIKNDGAYLVICQGGYMYASGLVLKSPLTIEAQELTGGNKIRVNVKEKSTGSMLNGVHVKAVGSANTKFQKGETDLRGVWESQALSGKVTVIARDEKGRYAFYRGTNNLSVRENEELNSPVPLPSKSVDFMKNVIGNQQKVNTDNRQKLEKAKKEGRKRGFKVKEILLK